MFFRSSKPKGAHAEARPANEMPVVSEETDIDQLMSSGIVMLFKHSAACPVSWMAHAHVARFRSRNPDIQVHLIPVIEQRATSRKIAELTKVRHESPQVIVLRDGVVESVASHEEITEGHLSGVFAAL